MAAGAACALKQALLPSPGAQHAKGGIAAERGGCEVQSERRDCARAVVAGLHYDRQRHWPAAVDQDTDFQRALADAVLHAQ